MTKDAENATGDVEKTAEKGDQKQEQTFTQADVDRIVLERAERIAKQRYADYDDLKAKAGKTDTAEERLEKLEQELASTKANALRTRVAARFNISTEPGADGSPSDADLFLTGSDESTLTTQAQRLAVREADRKKQGNVAPKEGTTSISGKDDSNEREFVKQLFGSAE